MKPVFISLTIAFVPILASADTAKMKAIVAHEFGGAEVMKLEEVSRPAPRENEMLVKVIAAGVNPVDAMIRSGMFSKSKKLTEPLVPGGDIAGVVEKAGSGITRFKPGDHVYAYVSLRNNGGYAEYARVTEKEAALKPKSISFVEAAAVPIVALTAWQALFDKARLAAGQTVLIHGGSGGVGTFAIQFAKTRGAKVIATASTQNQDFLKQLGADVAIDYKTQKFEDIAKDVDVVLDSVGGETLKKSYGVLKKGGFVATLVDRIDQSEISKRGIRGESIDVEPNSAELAEIGKLIDDKKVRVFVSQTLPLADAVKAHQQVETGHTRGKIVLKVADDPK